MLLGKNVHLGSELTKRLSCVHLQGVVRFTSQVKGKRSTVVKPKLFNFCAYMLMVQKWCAVGMCNAMLRNHIKTLFTRQILSASAGELL